MGSREKILSELCDYFKFDYKAFFRANQLVYRQEVRQMCADNSCKAYNTSWVCPPACGNLEEIRQKTRQFDKALIVQDKYLLDDVFDYRGMMAGQEKHQDKFAQFVQAVKNKKIEVFPMSAGACTRCEPCSYPEAPCLFPESAFPSMEACGLMVSDVCKDAGIEYYHGPKTVAYSSLLLFEGEGVAYE